MNNPYYMNPYQQMYGQGTTQAVPDQLAMYRQPYQSTGQMPVQNAVQPEPMTWVQGEAGAKAYIVAPGNTVVLWDSEADVIYIKSANGAGLPSMRVFDYRERIAASTPSSASVHSDGRYVTREEFDALAAQINALVKEKEVLDVE